MKYLFLIILKLFLYITLLFLALGYRNRSMSETRSTENKRHTLAGPPTRSPLGDDFRKKDKSPVPISPTNFTHPYENSPEMVQPQDKVYIYISFLKKYILNFVFII